MSPAEVEFLGTDGDFSLVELGQFLDLFAAFYRGCKVISGRRIANLISNTRFDFDALYYSEELMRPLAQEVLRLRLAPDDTLVLRAGTGAPVPVARYPELLVLSASRAGRLRMSIAGTTGFLAVAAIIAGAHVDATPQGMVAQFAPLAVGVKLLREALDHATAAPPSRTAPEAMSSERLAVIRAQALAAVKPAR
jgi:hypothetical protein